MEITKIDDNHYSTTGDYWQIMKNGDTSLKEKEGYDRTYVAAGKNKLCTDNTCAEFILYDPKNKTILQNRPFAELIFKAEQ